MRHFQRNRTDCVCVERRDEHQPLRSINVDIRGRDEPCPEYGDSAVVAVDLTPAETEFSVVRTIVPELETLMVDGRFGKWTSQILNPFLLVR